MTPGRRRVSTFGAVVGEDVMVEAADEEASKKGSVEKGKRGRQNAKVKWKVRKVRLCSNSSRSQVGRGGNCRPKGRKEQERKREWKPRGR